MKEYIEITLVSVFFGFGIYTIIFLLIRPYLSEFKRLNLDKYDNSACSIIAVTGGLYLLIWIVDIIMQFQMTEEQYQVYMIRDKLSGPYWLSYWIQPFLFLSSQLLWLKKVRKMKFVRFIVALMLMTSIESLVIYLTSLHRDYLPSIWNSPISARIMDWFISLGLFGAITTIFHLIKTKLKVYYTQ